MIITPHLWYDREAVEAAELYASIFPDSQVEQVVTIPGTPSGDAQSVNFRLAGQPFMAISGGPHFRPNPSISFMVNYDPSRDPKAREQLDAAWEVLSEGGTVRMPLDSYPFSPRYGWIEDRWGVSWQLILSDATGEPRPFILPSLLFVGEVYGKAEEAGAFYRSVFPDSQEGLLVHYPAGVEHDREGAVMFSDFRLGETWLTAMDSGYPHDFAFTEGVSFIVPCKDQAEIDYFWGKLSAVPEAEQCGWCKDKYGVSWQVIPEAMDEMMRQGNPEQIQRVVQAFLPMKKLDLATLERAYTGSP